MFHRQLPCLFSPTANKCDMKFTHSSTETLQVTVKTATQRRIFTLKVCLYVYANNWGHLNEHCEQSKVDTRFVFELCECCFIVLCRSTSCSMSLMNSPCFECPSTSFLALCRCSCRALNSSGLALKTSRQMSK